jgi:hypothetical protein
MLQDARAIRFYQRLTDALVELRQRGYTVDELRLYLDGYLAALRHGTELEPYWVHRLEEEAVRFMYDPANLMGVS